jgi:acetyltransferase-like isoleucine patch superfamily enzyme
MISIQYIWAKMLKKIRGSAIINSKVAKTAKIYSGSHVVNSEIERYTYCGYDCEIINAKIGSFCSIAGDVKIGGAMHPTNWVSTSPIFYEGLNTGLRKKFSNHPIKKEKVTRIGSDVWIGNNVLIKQGITIGNGSIIGMGSVVTKDVPPFAIVGGVPAKVIRYRFNDTIIEELSKSEWWNMSDDEIFVYAENFNDPLSFIEKIKR